MRESVAGPTLAEQEALLRQAGIKNFGRDAPVYIDKLRRGPVATMPERDKMVRYLRPGDVVVIAKASRLGTTRADRLQTLAAITKRSASIYDADTGEGVQLQPEAIRAMAFLDRAESGSKREVAARMRARKVALGATGGRPERLQGKTKAAAAVAWADLTKTARDVALEFNVGARALYRLFGPKGTPRFGRKD
ncbi:recombinase family protein [Teichococcus wenyumeiae]|nr:recombinase family protein [Pseudoroseomonas wenyumeiae]